VVKIDIMIGEVDVTEQPHGRHRPRVRINGTPDQARPGARETKEHVPPGACHR
jgi:hypothetical protein